MPSFVTRVERPDRGGEWIAYLEGRERAADRWVRRLGLDRESEPDARPSVRLLHVDGDEDALLAALLFEAAGVGEEETRIRLAALSARRAHRAAGRPGGRARQPPPPARPRLRGAALPLRDRLRLRRLPRPPAPPDADRPVAAPDPAPRRRRARRGAGGGLRRPLPPRARRVTRRVGAAGRRGPRPRGASTRCRWATASATSSTSTRARRCSSSSCAPAARATPATAPSRTRCTASSPQVHPAVAGAMTHVDTEAEPRLERILSEMRTQAQDRRAQRALSGPIRLHSGPRRDSTLTRHSGPSASTFEAKNPRITGFLHLTHHGRVSNSCNRVCALG